MNDSNAHLNSSNTHINGSINIDEDSNVRREVGIIRSNSKPKETYTHMLKNTH